jgi:RNA polymerase sigma-70 factor (ECF subfamily)
VHRSAEEDATSTSAIERIPQPANGDFEALWDREWRATLMDAAVARVKPRCSVKQWQIFDLHVLQEWSVREVTGTLGVSAGRVYLARHRISALLRKELKRLERAALDPGR